jgi:hypothetical protein
MEQSKIEIRKVRVSLNFFYCRRDFRQAKVDPITKQVVVNPIIWLEMPGIEIVKRYP